MKTKKIIMAILCVVMTLAISMNLYITTYADAASVQTAVQGAIDKNGGSLPSNLSGLLTPGAVPSADQSVISVTVNGVLTSYVYSNSNEETIISTCNSTVASSDLNTAMDTFTLKANIPEAVGVMSGFTHPLEVFLGIMVTLITLGMTVFTTFDLCYIAFPLFRGKMDEAKANGTKGVTKTGKGGETKLTLVTEDAQYAVVAADMANSGENAFLVYFKKRVLSFIVLAVLLFILVTGKINILANIGIKLADGILRVLSGM